MLTPLNADQAPQSCLTGLNPKAFEGSILLVAKLVTPIRMCWLPCLYVNGPPLSPYNSNNNRGNFGFSLFYVLLYFVLTEQTL